MSSVVLHGTWLDPTGEPQAGRILASLDPAHRSADVFGGVTTRRLDDTGSLPVGGAGALTVTAPDSGSWTYHVEERLDGDLPVTYPIPVTAADAATGIDLTAHGPG